MTSETLLQLQMTREGLIHRRKLLRMAAAGPVAGGLLHAVRLQAATLKQRRLACILVWLGGGPSQFETWDPKPGVPNGGPTQAVATKIPGIKIAQHWPKTAEVARELAFVRSMTNREGNHQRATYQLHTGRTPAGPLKYPNIGSVVAQELGELDSELPNFVSVGNTVGPGFLGVHAAPFLVQSPGQLPANIALPVPPNRLQRRLRLLREQDRDLAVSGARAIAEEHQGLYAQAARMILSPKLKAFDLQHEKDPMRDAYGRSSFGQGLLMARRLVESGVPFVEVSRGGWDNHRDVFKQVPKMAAQVDPAFAQLIRDLKARGMLDSTLVVCMGEFGRTPTINKNAGRDHWPRTFSAVLAGCGIKGGQVIGKTSPDGTEVADRPVSVPDLFQSLCHALRLDPATEFITPLGRPVKIMDEGAKVNELFG